MVAGFVGILVHNSRDYVFMGFAVVDDDARILAVADYFANELTEPEYAEIKDKYSIVLTRDMAKAKAWFRKKVRGSE